MKTSFIDSKTRQNSISLKKYKLPKKVIKFEIAFLKVCIQSKQQQQKSHIFQIEFARRYNYNYFNLIT